MYENIEFPPSALSNQLQFLLEDNTPVKEAGLLLASFPAYLKQYSENKWRPINLMDYLNAVSKLDIGAETDKLHTLVNHQPLQFMAAMSILKEHGYIHYQEGNSRIGLSRLLMDSYREFLALHQVAQA